MDYPNLLKFFTVGFLKLLSTHPIHIVVWGSFPFNANIWTLLWLLNLFAWIWLDDFAEDDIQMLRDVVSYMEADEDEDSPRTPATRKVPNKNRYGRVSPGKIRGPFVMVLAE